MLSKLILAVESFNLKRFLVAINNSGITNTIHNELQICPTYLGPTHVIPTIT
jgi:hypothetical protein